MAYVSKTGGGIGSNGSGPYGVPVPQRTGATPGQAVPPVLDMETYPDSFFPTVTSVTQPDDDTLIVGLSSYGEPVRTVFQRTPGGDVLVTDDNTPTPWPVRSPEQFGPWGPGWVARFYDCAPLYPVGDAAQDPGFPRPEWTDEARDEYTEHLARGQV
jgi:hypothetical protein